MYFNTRSARDYRAKSLKLMANDEINDMRRNWLLSAAQEANGTISFHKVSLSMMYAVFIH